MIQQLHNLLWGLPVVSLLLAGCSSVTPTHDTVKIVAAEIVGELSPGVGESLKNFGTGPNPYASPSPWNSPNTVGVTVQIPLEPGKPPAEPPLSDQLDKSKLAVNFMDNEMRPKTPMPDLRPDPLLFGGGVDGLRKLAVEIVQAERLFWPDAESERELVEQISTGNPDSRAGFVRWKAGHCSIKLAITGMPEKADADSGRENVSAATLAVCRPAAGGAQTLEKELVITPDSRAIRLHRADSTTTRPPIGAVIPGRTILAWRR